MLYPKNLRKIEGVLHTLGLLGYSVSMRQMVYAVELAHEDLSLLTNVSKGLYQRVAEEMGNTNNTAVERNLRALRDRQWAKGDREWLREMAMYQMKMKPSTGEFIDIIRYYMEANDLLPDG